MNESYRVRQRAVQRVLFLTLVLNLLVVVIKGAIGLWTGSLSLLADALHSVTDSLNNVLGLFTVKLADPQPDREYPYGRQKYEAVGALGIAAFLGVACFEILQSAVERLGQRGKLIQVSEAELGLMVVVLGINIGVALYERQLGKQLQSPILLADAQHTMSDVWITISVLLGLVGIWLFRWQWLDGVLSLPVAVLVFWSAWEVLKTNLPWLVDEMAIAPETIREGVMSVPGVLNCHQIASRGVLGRQVFIEMHLVVEAEDVATAHQITEAVEWLLEERYHPVRVLIHVEPKPYSSEELSYS